jgi:DNA-binding PadR family transcriptional regulator
MSQRDLPGQFEQMVLLAVARRAPRAHGMAIHDELLTVTGRDVSIPALYVTLSRLEKKGLVSAGVEADEEGGRSRKCYRLEASGAEALTKSRALLDDLWDGVDLPTESAAK